ncbi:hypothetical protein GTP45_25195 [Pseudoduganella sp. FT55W]|uniref:Calcium-binding protein n=2 Tax=Duganella rivi TaxID=2666083 RepID=A0A7X4GUS9_9BURK|nr:hypothetical protein [Duganella rivi]
MVGGVGNNTFVVDSTGDLIVDGSWTDVDQVLTSLTSYTLGAGLSNLKYTVTGASAAAFSGTGNAMDNLIEGGVGNDELKGQAGNDTLAGGIGNDTLSGGDGADWFVFGAAGGSDTVTDFVSGSDHVLVSLPIGNGDSVIDGGVKRTAPGGFSSDAELVLFTQKMATASTDKAAALIGSATSAYAIGDTALFAVATVSGDTVLYRFQASNADAVVSAGELTVIATLTGTPSTALADYSVLGSSLV